MSREPDAEALELIRRTPAGLLYGELDDERQLYQERHFRTTGLRAENHMSNFKLAVISLLVPSLALADEPAPVEPAPVDPTADKIHALEQRDAALDDKTKRLEEQLHVLEVQLESARQDSKPKPSRWSVPDWVKRVDDQSDLRMRIDEAKAPSSDFVTRRRYRPRLRLGGIVTLDHRWEIGFRVASTPSVGKDSGGDPLSTNQTFEDNGSRKPVAVDWAFARWTPVDVHGVTGSIAVGKLENPPNFTEDVFDVDYTPEGASETVTWKTKAHVASLYLGQFQLDELAFRTRDPFLLLEQIHEESTWSKRFASAVTASALTISRASLLTTTSVPDSNHGNTRDAGGAPTNKYQLLIVDARATVKLDRAPGYAGGFPITLFGEYIHNIGADADNTGYSFGPTIGNVSQRKFGRDQTGHWELSYRYQHLEGDYNYEELTASDNGAFYKSPPPNEPSPMSFKSTFLNGTNLRGHAYRAAFVALDFLVIDLRIWRNEAINVASSSERVKGTRVLLDAVLRF